MESFEEYMRSFEENPKELIVRIVWFPEKAPAKPDSIAGMLKMRARFDEAIDAESGERIGKGKYNWLEWTYRKKLFGDPFGYTMKKGSIYRLRVRRKTTGNHKNAETYYVDDVLEKDMKDRRLDPILSFLDSFEEEEKEMLFLNKQQVSGWGVFWNYKRVVLTYLARMNADGTEYHDGAGRLFLLEKNPASHLKAKYSDLTVYRLRVRPSKNDPETYLVVKDLGSADPTPFAGKIEDYKRPVTIENELGTFTLERRWNWFDGTIQWCSQPCNVLIDVPEGSTDCTSSMAVLRRICEDDKAFDARVRRQTCDQTMELLADWYDEEITEEEYMQRMGVPMITISEDGRIDFSFDTGDLYAGHALVVSVDEAGNVHSTDLVG
ncbi:MAG: DUF2262 domain-containing protein [Solobacterium sp.]|nr:DUF2262 domain-containing protein [Solobacterium sp.]